jgi:hypothetical protein
VESDSGTHTTYTVSVRSLAQVPGDVDYSTGNIDFKGNVEIKGRVVSGFKVKATGDIIISEGVEDAVEITGDGSLSVRQGIVGSKTKVNVKGGVEAKFIQDALVEAEGDVEVDAYVRTAEIQTHGSVIVKGKGAAGGILGGETWALKSIDTKRAGSERSTTTVLSVGVLPSLFEDFAKKREEAEKANTTREAILKAMGIQALKPDDIKQAIIRNPHKKDKILEWIQKANEVGAQQKQLIGEMKELTAKLKESAAKAYADVQDTAFSRVKVRVGNQERVLDEDLRAVRFHLDKTGEVAGVVDTNLSDVGKLEQEDEGEQEEKSE